MSNNNKQPLNLSLPVFANGLGIPKIKRPDVTTQYLSHSDDESTVGELLRCAERGKNHREDPMRDGMNSDDNQLPPSICKVSRILRDLSEKSFIPQLVSIGPIHREDPKLKEFEWLKECYLNDLLSRCDSPKKTLEACLERINDLIPEIRESYADVTNYIYSDVELARMMVMDGCFIIEFCFKHESGNWHLPKKMQTRRIAMDLILLENQVPFFVLEALFDCFMGKRSFNLSQVLDAYLAPYIKLFSSDLLPEKNPTTHVDSDSTPAHVLGYLHKLYQPIHAEASKLVDEELAPVEAEASKLVDEELAAKSSNPVEAEAFRGHTIVELDRSGMNFKPHQEDDWSMTIKFQSSLFPWFGSKSTLLMPTLVIHNFTELIFRNFIAYEQSFPHVRYYFTSYAYAMDLLIDTREDIAKLVESKVLLNMLVTNQEAADMINMICKYISITDFYYTQEFEQMDKYYNGYWPQIKRIYFSNPWNAINLLVGTIVFLATVVSAIFTVLQYFG